MTSHLNENPSTDDSKDWWLEDDAVSFSKFVTPLMVKYSLSLIIVSWLRS